MLPGKAGEEETQGTLKTASRILRPPRQGGCQYHFIGVAPP